MPKIDDTPEVRAAKILAEALGGIKASLDRIADMLTPPRNPKTDPQIPARFPPFRVRPEGYEGAE